MAEEKKVATKKSTSSTAKKPTAAKTTAPKAETPVAAKPAAKKASKGVAKAKIASRIRDHYENDVKKALLEKYKYSSVMQIPALNKIVINIGVGDATIDSKRLDEAVAELGQITGQKPVVTRAKKSIASFKLREGQAIGCKVTLRGERMYQFYDKLVSISLPRVRDFRGLSKNSFDGRGNYTIGIKEQLIFPEINYDKVFKIRGMDIVIVTTARTDEEGRELLTQLGMPFKK